MTDRTTEQKPVPRWTDRSDKTWPVEVVPAWAYDDAKKEVERLQEDRRKLVHFSKYIAKGGVDYVGAAREVLALVGESL